MNNLTPPSPKPHHAILGKLVEAMANKDQVLFDSLISSCDPALRERLIAILFRLNPNHPFLSKYLSAAQKIHKSVENIPDFLARQTKQGTEPAAEGSIAIDHDAIAKNRTQNGGSSIGNKNRPD